MGNETSQGNSKPPDGVLDLANVPPGTMIALKAWNGRYLTADIRDAAVCSLDTPGPAAQQRFTIVKANENRFFLRSCFGYHLSINVLGYVGFHNAMGGCEEFSVIYENGQPVFKGYSSGKFLWINNDGSASGRGHTENNTRFQVEIVSAITPGSPMAMQLQRAVQMRIRYAQLDDKEDAAWIAGGSLGTAAGLGNEFAQLGQAGATFTALNIDADMNAIYQQNFADIIATPIESSPMLPVAQAAVYNGGAVYNGAALPPNAPPPPYVSPPPLPAGWREMKTPDGQIYYADDNTGTTSWTRP